MNARAPLPGRLILLPLLLCSLPRVFAQSSTTAWSAAVLDQILAAVPPGQRLATVGDMQLLVSNLKAWRAQLAGGPAPKLAFDGTVPTWTGGNVYYTFDGSVSAAKQKAFLDGAQEWATFANLHFIPRSTETNYVTIQESASLEGGQSAVGMVGGQQLLQIGPTSWNRGTICHELGHTLGLIHEHQRSDRDSFVVILTNSIMPGQEGNFIKLANSANKNAYDFYSVMHYSRNTFSINPATLDTIEPLPAFSQFLNVIGGDNDTILSVSDRAGMALVYGAGPALAGVVSNTQDSGPGSLRAALYFAHDNPDTTVTFNIPVSDAGFSNNVFNIQPTDQLPTLARATTLDGTTQPTNANPSGPSIVLNGALALPPSVFPQGLRLRGTNCTVRGLVINGFAANGIQITGSNAANNGVQGCYLGTDPAGATPVTNGFTPITIASGAHDNTIGGMTAAARNIISGSAYQGFVLTDPGTRNNVVQGNYIGLNATGTAPLPNAWSGVAIYGGAQSNLIGGTVAGTRNVIAGNTLQGVTLSDTNTTGNVVLGNFIGLNPSGTAALPNGWAGVDIFGGAQSNLIGGTVPGARNVISGNGAQGVLVSGPDTAGNTLAGNYIGLDAAGTTAVLNAWAGVQLASGAHSNTVGGATAAARNVISGNGGQGVVISDAATRANIIAGNFIGVNPTGTAALGNGWSGVDIFGGATANVIGGRAGARNLISGNNNDGLRISGAGSDGNIVQGNFVGLDAGGGFAIPNAWAGVEVFGGARSNLLGGTAPGLGNVISGNTLQGVVLAGPNTTGNVAAGNFIGVDATGAAAVANHGSGVDIFGGASANVIGGGPGARNVISGNASSGVALSGAGTAENLVQGNTIGLNATASAAVPNSYAGVVLFGSAVSNLVGGVTLGAANLIAGNLSDGVQLFDAATTNNTVRGNSISGNNGAGIALFTSANRSAPAPTLTSAVLTTNTTVTGSLSDLPNTTFHLDFYSGGAGGFGAQARVWLGSADVTTGSGGTAPISQSLAAVVPMGQLLTATSTDPAGNTSPLAAAIVVTGTDSVGDGIPNAWRSAHFGGSGTTTNNQSCATCDPDHDGLNNWQEFLAGTDPTNAASALRIDPLSRAGPDINVEFLSALDVPYRVDFRPDVTGGAWSILADQIPGSGGFMLVTHPGAGNLPRGFYRVEALR